MFLDNHATDVDSDGLNNSAQGNGNDWRNHGYNDPDVSRACQKEVGNHNNAPAMMLEMFNAMTTLTLATRLLLLLLSLGGRIYDGLVYQFDAERDCGTSDDGRYVGRTGLVMPLRSMTEPFALPVARGKIPISSVTIMRAMIMVLAVMLSVCSREKDGRRMWRMRQCSRSKCLSRR